MAIELPPLPYDRTALEPHISGETIDYHYGKHHKAYVDNLNKMIEGTEFADMPLEDIIRKSQGGMFNNAAQIWNHTFYWNCLKPAGGGEPSGKLADAIAKAFGGFDKFKEQFKASKYYTNAEWRQRYQDGTVTKWLQQVTDFFVATAKIQNAVKASEYFDPKPFLEVVKA